MRCQKDFLWIMKSLERLRFKFVDEIILYFFCINLRILTFNPSFSKIYDRDCSMYSNYKFVNKVF
jgi:hypothetical protein